MDSVVYGIPVASGRFQNKLAIRLSRITNAITGGRTVKQKYSIEATIAKYQVTYLFLTGGARTRIIPRANVSTGKKSPPPQALFSPVFLLSTRHASKHRRTSTRG